MAQLVVQTAFPGDLLLSVPLVRQIRKFYPDDKIVLLCRPGLGEFFLKEKLVDEVFEVNKKDKRSSRETLKKLRAQTWTRVFCPHESYRSAWWVRSLRVKEFSVGFKKWWNFWAFSVRVKKPPRLPDALRQLALLRGVSPEFREIWFSSNIKSYRSQMSRADTFFNRPLPEWALMTLRSRLATENKIFIAPGSVWPTKMWTKEGFRDLAVSLSSKGFRVILVGSPGERELCEEIARQANVESLAGQTTISELIEHFRSGQALISNDSGAMHAASVAALPTVAVFGPTVLEFGFRPWQEKAAVVQLDLECRPCAAHGGKKCPLGTHACMRDLPFERVEDAVLKLIHRQE